MDESRVERLFRMAEEAAIEGDSERTFALLGVMSAAEHLEQKERKALRKMLKVGDE